MGNLIEDLKKTKPEFRSEFDTYIQQVKLENREELSNLQLHYCIIKRAARKIQICYKRISSKSYF